MAERSDGCGGETSLALCAWKQEAAGKDDTGYVPKKILDYSVCREMIVKALFTYLCLQDKLGLCSINCHVCTMTGNCCASLQVLANSLRAVFVVTGNLP